MFLYIDSPGAITPACPSNHDEFQDEEEQRRLDHRRDDGGRRLGAEVQRVPYREAAPAATLTREPVPDRKGKGHELPGRERRARIDVKRALEDDRPLALVVLRGAGHVPRVVRRDVGAPLADELLRRRVRQIVEPEIHGVLRIAEDEVRLARARRYL